MASAGARPFFLEGFEDRAFASDMACVLSGSPIGHNRMPFKMPSTPAFYQKCFCFQTQQWQYFDTYTLPEAQILRIRHSSFEQHPCPWKAIWEPNIDVSGTKNEVSGTKNRNMFAHWPASSDLRFVINFVMSDQITHVQPWATSQASYAFVHKHALCRLKFMQIK